MSKGSLVAISAAGARVAGEVPEPGLDSCGFSTVGFRFTGGFTKAFCRNTPITGWS